MKISEEQSITVENKMSYEQTMEKMKAMRLYGMLRQYQSSCEIGFKKLSPDELVASIVDAEFDDRYNKRYIRLLQKAKFRYKATLAELNFQIKRNLDKNLIMRFSTNTWIKKKQNILITGPTGSGKSFIACALGHNACAHGDSVIYHSATKLFKLLKLSNVDGTYIKEINKIKKSDLFILDDFGLDTFDKQTRLFLLEIIEDRHGEKSTIITSQFPVSSWYELIAEKTIADAICDRLLHNSHRIELKGDSLRKKFIEELT